MRRNALKALSAFVAAATVVSLVAPTGPAGADQLSSDRAEAQYLANKITALGNREGALGEAYNAGVIALHQANARVNRANKELRTAQSEEAKTMGNLRVAAMQAYVGGGPASQLDNTPGLANLNQAMLRQELEQTFASDQSDALNSYQLAAAEASSARTRLELARNTKAKQVAALHTDKDQVEAAENQVEQLQDQVKGRIASLVAEIEHQKEVAAQKAEAALLAQERRQAQQAAQAAADQRAAEARQAQLLAAQQQAAAARQAADAPTVSATTVPTAPPPVTTDGPAVPGESPQAAGAIAAAESRLGDPYVWAGAGPDVFDCSGLVMWSWAQVGVSLPHNAADQYSVTVHIPMYDLQPGDLVYPSGLFHVAMYIGNGEIIQAPYTGANVQIVPLTNFFTLASRVG